MEKLRQGLKDKIIQDLNGNDLFNVIGDVCLDALRARLGVPVTIADDKIKMFILIEFPSVNFV